MLMQGVTTFVREEAGGAFSPSDVSGLVVWLDGDDDTSITEDGNGISEWAGQSPTTVDFVQATDGFKPNTTAAFQNGLDCVEFLIVNDEDMATAADIGMTLNTDDAAIWVVYAMDSVTPDQCLIVQTDGTGTGRNWVQYETTGDVQRTAIGGSGIDSDTSRVAVTTYLDGFIYDQSGATFNFRTNGAADGTHTSITGEAANGSVRIATAKSGGQDFGGQICEILIYDTVPSGGEIASIESYLNAKWAVY